MEQMDAATGSDTLEQKIQANLEKQRKLQAQREARGFPPVSDEELRKRATNEVTSSMRNENAAMESQRKFMADQFGTEAGERAFRSKYPDWKPHDIPSASVEKATAAPESSTPPTPDYSAAEQLTEKPSLASTISDNNTSKSAAPVKTTAGAGTPLFTGGANPKGVNDALAASQQARASQKPFDASKYEGESAEARKLYQEEKARNENLELAQLIGKSVARMGAAYQGSKRGRYLGEINPEGIDYSKRTEGARADYRDSLQDIVARRSEAGRQHEKQQEADVQGKMDALKVQEFLFKEQNDAAARHDSEVRATQRNDQAIANQNRLYGKDEYGRLSKEEQGLTQQTQAVNAIANALASGDEKQKKNIPGLAARAGIDPAQLDRLMSEAPKNKGFLWDSEDPKQQGAYISDNLLGPLKARLQQIQVEKNAAKQMALTGKTAVAAAQESQQQAVQPEQQQATQLSDRDKQALAWANANPQDPRAIEIKKRLGK